MRQAGRALPEYREIRERHTLIEITRQPDLCAEVTLQPVRRLGVDAAILFADITLPFFGLGADFEIRPGVGPVIENPVRTPADVDRLRPFDPLRDLEPLFDAIAILGSESPVPLIGFAGAPFTLASYLVEGGPTRKFQEVKGFMFSQPRAWESLMERLTEATIAYLAAQVDAGATALQVFDSWVGSLSPVSYRRFVQPHMKRLFASLPDVPVIHFGTDTAGLLPSMAEAGGDVIGVDWRIDIDRAWRMVGDRGVQGNLDPVMAAGDWEPIEREARAILDAVGGRPGHVFNLGHGVLPHTPVDNLRRLVDLVHGHTVEPGEITDEEKADPGSRESGDA
jgi:uroporphyrinogen decarboxylase